MDLNKGKVYTTISHKRTKGKPKFNFSMVVAGFLISTTMLSTTIATPAYAKEAYADNTVSATQTMNVSSSYELSQLKTMLKQGILDVEILTSIDNSLNTLMADLANGKVDTYSDEFRKIVSSTTVAYDKIDIDALTITNGSKEDAETLIEDTKRLLENFQYELSFKDVKVGDWFCEEVQSAAAHGLIDGIGANLFDPQGNLSVAEAIKLASCARASFNDELDGLEPDTSGTIHWVVPYMDYAVKMGIIDSSLSDAELDSYITRDGMAKIFAKALPDSQYKDINDLSLIPDSNVPDYVKKLFKAGIMIGDEDNPTFRLNDNITRAETACIINRVLLPKQRQVVEKPVDLYPGNYPGTLPGAKPGFEGSGNTGEINTGNVEDILESIRPGSSYITDIDKKPETPSKSYTLQKDPATGKYIPFNDPAMAEYNRPAMVEFIYGFMQDKFPQGSSSKSYKSLYTAGINFMSEEFGGIDIEWANNNRAGTRSLASTDDYNKLVAGDYISVPNWGGARMLVVERLDGAIVVIEPTATTFQWKVYTWEQLDVIRRKFDNNSIGSIHTEFLGI